MLNIHNFPKRLDNTEGIYEFLCVFWNTFKNSMNSKIILNFKDTRWIAPNMIACLGLILVKIKSNKNQIFIKNIRDSVKKLLIKYNFILSQNNNIIPQNYIKYKTFYGDSNDEFKQYLFDELKDIKNSQIIELLISRLMEIFINVKMHARNNNKSKYKNKEIFSSGYYNNCDNYVCFSIANNGRTFAENISNYFNYQIINECDFIKWAVKPGNTTSSDLPGGLGLFLLNKLIIENYGELIILSGKGFYRNNNGIILKKDFSTSFPGTIITVRIPIKSLNSKCNLNNNLFYNVSDLMLEVT